MAALPRKKAGASRLVSLSCACQPFAVAQVSNWRSHRTMSPLSNFSGKMVLEFEVIVEVVAVGGAELLLVAWVGVSPVIIVSFAGLFTAATKMCNVP